MKKFTILTSENRKVFHMEAMHATNIGDRERECRQETEERLQGLCSILREGNVPTHSQIETDEIPKILSPLETTQAIENLQSDIKIIESAIANNETSPSNNPRLLKELKEELRKLTKEPFLV